MKRLLANHWPVILAIAMFILCVTTFNHNVSLDVDLIGVALLYFYIGIPLMTFIIGLWYGYRVRRWLRWLTVPACGVGTIIMFCISTGDYDVMSNILLAIFGIIPAAVGTLIAFIIVLIKEKVRKHHS